MNSDRSQVDRSGNATLASSSICLLKKLVLLVDVNAHTRDSRAKVMRARGVTVHCASSARAARSKLDSGTYNLILVDLGTDAEGAEALVHEIRLKDPRQLVAFLVGSPLFVAASLRDKGGVPSRASQSIVPSFISKPITQAKPFDFGQKVKDAEAEEVV